MQQFESVGENRVLLSHFRWALDAQSAGVFKPTAYLVDRLSRCDVQSVREFVVIERDVAPTQFIDNTQTSGRHGRMSVIAHHTSAVTVIAWSPSSI